MVFKNKALDLILVITWVVSCLALSGCANRPAMIDYDKQFDFSQLRSYSVESINPQDQLSANRLIEQTKDILSDKGYLIGDVGYVDGRVEIDHFIEERANDSRFSIGLGTGSYGRSSSIGVGGSVDLPMGADIIPYAVIRVNVLVDNRTVWSAIQSAEIDPDEPNSTSMVQTEIVNDIFAKYPPETN